MINVVQRAYRLIAEHPHASIREREDIRVRSVQRFPYRVYYRVRSEEILIIAIGHRRRRPGFWRPRV